MFENKRFLIISCLVLLIICFFVNWYKDNIAMTIGVFFCLFIRIVLLIILLNLLLMIIKNKKISNYFLLMILLIFVVSFIDFRFVKVKYELKKYENQTYEIINDIRHSGYNNENVKLSKYQNTSNDKSVFVYQNNEDQVISFWIYRGLKNTVELIYSSQDENLIYDNLDKIL